MNLDIRIPIGLMFGIIGLILATFGLISGFLEPKIYERSLGFNVNLIWGCVLLGFSVVMLGLARRAKNKTEALDAKSQPSQENGKASK